MSADLRLQAAAILELRRRERERTRARLEGSFLEFVRYFFPILRGTPFLEQEHHRLIIGALEEVARGKTERLIINVPPGYGKTEIAIVMFAAWGYALSRSARFLHLSYSADLAELNSSAVRDLINLDEYQALWPTDWSDDVAGKGLWQTKEGAQMRAASSGSAVTGFRAGRMAPGYHGAILIDDPLKAEDADSDIIRARMNERLVKTIKSRLMHSRVPVVLIMQRLHDDDPTGYLLEGKSGDTYKSLVIPAILDEGKATERAICPEKDSLEYLRAFKAAAPYVFAAQYQQRPGSDDGIYFRREQFRWYSPGELPDGEALGSSDYATTEGGGDYTEHGVGLITAEGHLYLVDWWGGQRSSEVWVEEQIRLMRGWGIKTWAGETGPIKNAVEPWLTRRMREDGVWCTLEWFSHGAHSKEANARGFQALVASGRVWLPKGEPWAHDLVDQLVRFPAGKHDDKVDACSIMSRLIDKVWASRRPAPAEKRQEGLTIDEMIRLNRERKVMGRRR